MSRSSAPPPATPRTHHGKPEPEGVRAAAPGCEIRHVPLVIARYARPLGRCTINVRPPSRTESHIAESAFCSVAFHGMPTQCATPRTVSSAWTNGVPPGRA